MALLRANISPGFSPGFAGRCAPGRHEPTSAAETGAKVSSSPALEVPQALHRIKVQARERRTVLLLPARGGPHSCLG